ncbi:SurA N-terminal domain-containing protein [Neisseria dumasiana]|uniref:Periplasmic chaperone PpiD n=1 Tax=Neisseria dumasiana TaxID=1931275 RepID=A0A1X3DJD3_9NEIS|nr:SurA N-terminal domain-containing protein [Neisseria dumasiana]OSI22761.1 peptidylprolyl isomerase [Neisseria dumasiana]
MFVTVEKYKTPAKILLGLIAITFVGFGVSTVSAPGSDYIVKVGDRKVSEFDLNTTLQNLQHSGGASESRETVFQALLQRALLAEGAEEMGFAVSQEQLKQNIVNDRTFHDQNGKFSQNLFNQYLSQRNLSEDQYIDQLKSEFAVQHLLAMVGSGVLVSDAQAKQIINVAQVERTIRTITFTPEAFAAQMKADDAALKKYYDANKKNYLVPLAVKFEYVALNIQDLAEKQTISNEELNKALEQVVPAREIAHILFTVAKDAPENVRAAAKAEAEKVLAQVKANPAKFAALAKQYSRDEGSAENGGNLGYLPKDGGLLKEFEDKAFSLEKGQISELVQTDAGYHIITVLNIQDIEKEKARIEAELKQKKATSAFNEAKEKLTEEAFNHPDSLTEVAKKLGLKVEAPADWLTRENGKAAGMPDALINTLFSDDVIKKKHNSEPVTVGDGLIWVVRAKEVREESTQTFDQAKEFVKTDYIRAEAGKLAQTKANQALADVQKGKTAGLTWSPVSQMTAEQARKSMPPEAYAQLAKARPAQGKPAYALLSNLPAPVLVEVQAVKVPDNITQDQIKAIKQTIGQAQGANNLDVLITYLNSTIKQTQGAQKVNTQQE